MTDTTQKISHSTDLNIDSLLDIDSNIHRLIKRLELLAHINPQNIAQERKRFFQSKYSENPQFKYRKYKFTPYKIHRLFFSQRLERIDDESIRELYKDVIYFYSGLVQCIETIREDTSKFYYNSLRFYGTPTERMVENAKFILHLPNEEQVGDKYAATHSTEDAQRFFEEFKERYGFEFRIQTSSAMAASAMVSNKDKALILKKNHKFSQHQLEVLAHHEIGVHLVTTFNAADQPLHIFSNGFPNNVETQEGLAVLAEYLSGNLTVTRLKELAYRVIAVDSLAKGYDFRDTFDLLYSQYKLGREEAFTITLRVHRGGGFTKDALYLSGLKKMYDRYEADKNLKPLLLGKCSLEYLNDIRHLEDYGLVKKNTYHSPTFDWNLNTNKTVDFVLKNLK